MTSPAGRTGSPPRNANAAIASATAPTAIGAPQIQRSTRRALTLSGAARPAVAPARATWHPGHASPLRAQQRSHANSPQDGHVDNPIPASVAAGPIRLPQRSQNGRGPPLAGRAPPPEITGTVADRGQRARSSVDAGPLDPMPRDLPRRLPDAAGPHRSPPENPTPAMGRFGDAAHHRHSLYRRRPHGGSIRRSRPAVAPTRTRRHRPAARARAGAGRRCREGRTRPRSPRDRGIVV